MHITGLPPTRFDLPGVTEPVYIATQQWALEPWEGEDPPELSLTWARKGKFSAPDSRRRHKVQGSETVLDAIPVGTVLGRRASQNPSFTDTSPLPLRPWRARLPAPPGPRRARPRRQVLAACLSAHRTMINGSAHCAARLSRSVSAWPAPLGAELDRMTRRAGHWRGRARSRRTDHPVRYSSQAPSSVLSRGRREDCSLNLPMANSYQSRASMSYGPSKIVTKRQSSPSAGPWSIASPAGKWQ